MAKKLKGLQITSTDLVDRGANPDAFITLMKRKAGEFCEGVAVSLGGTSQPAGAPEEEPEDVGKSRKANTFAEEYAEDKEWQRLRELTAEMFDFCYSLSDSLSSIICDTTLNESQKAELMEKSLEQFNAVIDTATPHWAKGEPANAEIAHVEKEEQEEMLEKLWAENEPPFDGGAGAISAVEGSSTEGSTIQKQQEEEQMDLENMTPEDRAAYEALMKKYPQATPPAQPAPAAEPATPEVEATAKSAELNPEVAEALSEMKKSQAIKDGEIEELRKSLAMSELTNVAKKYEVLGKKPEELAAKLYEYKKSGGTVYEDMISILDEQVTMQSQSGMFHEIGKNAEGIGGARGKVQGAANEVAKNVQGMTNAEAIVKAFESNPDLMREYEGEYRGGNY